MKITSVTSFLPVIVAAGLALNAFALLPANAYGVVVTDEIAGNPGGRLVEVTLNGGNMDGIYGGDVGRTLDPVKWLVPANGSNPSVPLSAEASIKVEGFTSNLLSLAIKLTNTTTAGFQAAIVGLGLGVDPDATSATVTQGTLFDNVTVDPNANFPGGFKNVDVCVYAANNCQGGNVNQGLQSGGNYDTFLLKIAGNFGSTPSVTLSNFALKFQTQDNSYEAAGVPEPITVIGSGLALGFGALFKREISKNRSKEKVKS